MRSLLRLLCAVVLVASIVAVLRPDSAAGNIQCPEVTGEPNRDDPISDSDLDDDGLFDFDEIHGIPIQIHGETFTIRTDPTNCDTDDDGLKDGEEVNGFQITINGKKITVHSDPRTPDTDDDSINDKQEVDGYDLILSGREIRRVKTDPGKEDTDEDGLSDAQERGIDPITFAFE